MASEDNVTTLMVQENPQQVNFLNYKSEFTGILKTLSKASKGAVEMLEKIMAESDDDKLKLQAASKLMEFYVSVADKAQAEHLQRLVSQARLGGQGNTKQLVNAPSDDKPKPIVDFGRIRDLT